MKRGTIPVLFAALMLTATVSPTSAVTVSGQVVDEDGFGVFDVDLDFEDDDTGMIIFTPNDNTDAGGFYSVDVPPGTYNILFRSPHPMWLDREIRRVDIVSATTIDTFLWWAQLVVGNVRNSVGTPLAMVDLDFVEVATGDQFDANDDNSNLAGDFAVFVPGQTYDILFTAPVGQPYAGFAMFGVAVAGTTSLGTVVMPDGFAVTGDVFAPGGGPVVGADTDFESRVTGEVIYTPRDDTDGLGHLSVLVPVGMYDVTVKPPLASGLAWQTVHDVAVAGPVSIGSVTLANGVAVSGLVRDELGAPVSGGDLDMFDRSTGHDLPTPDDNTDGTGAFSLLAPSGDVFDLFVKPPPGTPVAAAALRNVSAVSPTNLGTIVLPSGFPITGTVRDVFGTPVVAADLDAFELATSLPFPLVGDDTDASGDYAIRLPGGNWTLTATPLAGSGLLSASVTVDPLAGPAVVDIVLPSATVGVPAVGAVSSTRLLPAFPNPFRGSTRLAFELGRPSPEVRIVVTDVTGRQVRVLRAGSPGTGRQHVDWDGRNDAGAAVAAGVYFYRLGDAMGADARRVTLLR